MTYTFALGLMLICDTDVWIKWWVEFNMDHPNQRIPYYLGLYTAFGLLSIFSLMMTCWSVDSSNEDKGDMLKFQKASNHQNGATIRAIIASKVAEHRLKVCNSR